MPVPSSHFAGLAGDALRDVGEVLRWAMATKTTRVFLEVPSPKKDLMFLVVLLLASVFPKHVVFPGGFAVRPSNQSVPSHKEDRPSLENQPKESSQGALSMAGVLSLLPVETRSQEGYPPKNRAELVVLDAVDFHEEKGAAASLRGSMKGARVPGSSLQASGRKLRAAPHCMYVVLSLRLVGDLKQFSLNASSRKTVACREADFTCCPADCLAPYLVSNPRCKDEPKTNPGGT